MCSLIYLYSLYLSCCNHDYTVVPVQPSCVLCSCLIILYHKQYPIVALLTLGSMVSPVSQLDAAVSKYYMAGLTASTHKTYRAAERRYLDFCGSFSITALPTSESTLCYFVTCLAQHGLSEGTIKTYLSGVRQLQISYGLQEPLINQMPRLRQILRGIKVEKGKAGCPHRSRLPITPMILRRMKPQWITGQPSFNSVMLWAAAVVTFFSFCRSGETTVGGEAQYDPSTHLSYSDVAVDDPDSPSIVSLFIKQSKTDQERVGVRVIIGRTGDDLCPISALLDYLRLRGSAPGALFIWQDGTPLTQSSFVTATRQALSAANLPAQDFAGHSYRIGAATTAAMAGIEDSTIQTLGRWKSASYRLYVRLDPQHLAAVSSTLSHHL